MSVKILDFSKAEGKCQLCGAENEDLRPYGPNGECICFTCGMKDEATTAKQFGKLLGDSDTVVFKEVTMEEGT
jgi:hypothetical protein